MNQKNINDHSEEKKNDAYLDNLVEENSPEKKRITIRYNAAELREICERSTDVDRETQAISSNGTENDSFIGKVIDDKYKVIELLGRGGMGSVYKVEHLLLKKYLAIKILHADLLENELHKKRFFREAQLCLGFNHENILPIREFNEVDGCLYFTMDYSQGSSLKSFMEDSGKLSEMQIVSIMRQILSALQVAHSKGIIHRDLKPENIFIEVRGDKHHALLLDFGIAKIYEKDSNNTRLTGECAIGTPYYMAPEQARGEELDSRADLYSLGVIFYEMATGTVPFKGTTHMDTLVSRLTTELPPPSSINPNISKTIEKVLVKALQRERENRFKNAEEFNEALSYIVKRETDSHKKKRTFEQMVHTPALKAHSQKKKSGGIYVAAIMILAIGVAAYFAFNTLMKQNIKENSTANIAQNTKDQDSHNLALIKKIEYIEIVPNKITLKPNSSRQFQCIPYNKFGYPTNFSSAAKWTTSIGEIDDSGNFRASKKSGEGVVSVTFGEMTGYAKITIKNPDIFLAQTRMFDDKKRSKKHFLMGDKIYFGFRYKKYVEKILHVKVTGEGMSEPLVWHSKKHTQRETIYLPLSISQVAKEYKLQVDVNIEDFKKTYTLSFKLREPQDRPEEWPTKLWEESWNGKWLDFTTKTWENLSVDKQKIYTREYQKWYAFHHGLSLKDGIVLPDDKTEIDMVLLPPGQYWMGSPNTEEQRDLSEGPRHKVLIEKAFWMSQYEITNAIWNQVMDKESVNNDSIPLTNVSWDECQEFCKKIDVELPTEEQWEYACRSGSTTKYFWGNEFDGSYAWSSQNSQFKIREVGKTKPNSFDLYDMSGNVFEWCQNNWVSNYDKKEFKATRVYRGGSFWSSPRGCRSSYRDRNPVSYRVQFLGFRIVKKIQ